MQQEIKRRDGESYTEYFVRLFENKDGYGITCSDIASLLNAQNGRNFSESTYRKEFRAFDRGRKYERRLESGGIHTRILSLSDFHVPYQLPVETFSEYRGSTDVLVLNGDIEDCQSVSSFPKKYRLNIVDEMVETRQYLIELIQYLRPKRVVVTRGNHEDRMLRHLSERVHEDLLQLMPDSPLDLIVNSGFYNTDHFEQIRTYYMPVKDVFPDIEIKYDGNWWCKIGKTIFAHPSAYSSGMLKTTERAVDFFLRKDRDFNAIVLAHTHKLGQYVQGGIFMYEQGCCCRTDKMNYTDGKLTLPSQKGYIFVAQDQDGNLIPAKTKLVAV